MRAFPKDELIKMANELLEMPEANNLRCSEKKIEEILWYLMIIPEESGNVFISLPFFIQKLESPPV